MNGGYKTVRSVETITDDDNFVISPNERGQERLDLTILCAEEREEPVETEEAVHGRVIRYQPEKAEQPKESKIAEVSFLHPTFPI